MALKFFLKCVAMCVIIFGATSYMSYLRTGVYWVPSLSNLKMPPMPNFGEITSAPSKPQTTSASFENENAPSYKWLENGKWHYGDDPPKGVKAELLNRPVEQ